MRGKSGFIYDLERVEVYWNFHRKEFSVKVRGKVVLHTKRAFLYGAQFKVSEAGRQRVLREKRKNVHAVIRGLWISPSRWEESYDATDRISGVSYNPYRGPQFTNEIGIPVSSAPYAHLNAEREWKIETRGAGGKGWRHEDQVSD
jgi:hypothetical protein